MPKTSGFEESGLSAVFFSVFALSLTTTSSVYSTDPRPITKFELLTYGVSEMRTESHGVISTLFP